MNFTDTDSDTAASEGNSHQPLDSLTRQFDISALPLIAADEDSPQAEEPAEFASTRRPLPPPSPRSRRRAELGGVANMVGRAAAAAAQAPAPLRLITVPKPASSARPDPLPRVMAPPTIDDAEPRYLGATLPPRERSAEPSVEFAAYDPRRGRARALRTAMAVGVPVLGLVTAAGVALARRDGAVPGEVRSTPAFLAMAAPTPTITPPPPQPKTEPPLATPTDSSPAPPAADSALSSPNPTPEDAQRAAPPSLPLTVTADAPLSLGGGHPEPREEPKAEAQQPSIAPASAANPKSKPAVGKNSLGRGSHVRGATPPRAMPVDRLATPSRAPGAPTPVDPITTYTFDADELFSIATAPRRMTDLILQPGEKLVTRPTAGDASLWVIHVVDGVQQDSPQQHVQVTPLRADTSTNLTLTTTRRNYHLELHSSMAGSYMAAVQWRYPADDAERRHQELTRLARERESMAQVSDVKALRFEYAIRVTAGAPEWKPTTVFDDGAQTFIRFPAPIPADRAPLLFVLRRGETKHAAYVNYRLRGDLFVVDRVIDTVELRQPPRDGDEPQIVRITRRTP